MLGYGQFHWVRTGLNVLAWSGLPSACQLSVIFTWVVLVLCRRYREPDIQMKAQRHKYLIFLLILGDHRAEGRAVPPPQLWPHQQTPPAFSNWGRLWGLTTPTLQHRTHPQSPVVSSPPTDLKRQHFIIDFYYFREIILMDLTHVYKSTEVQQ